MVRRMLRPDDIGDGRIGTPGTNTGPRPPGSRRLSGGTGKRRADERSVIRHYRGTWPGEKPFPGGWLSCPELLSTAAGSPLLIPPRAAPRPVIAPARTVIRVRPVIWPP